LGSVADIVPRSVDLDAEEGVGAVEVEHEPTDWMLPAKDWQAVLAAAKAHPEQLLRKAEFGA